MVHSMVKRKREKMKLLKLLVPPRWLRQLDSLVDRGLFTDRSEAVRRSIQTLLSNHPEVERIQ